MFSPAMVQYTLPQNPDVVLTVPGRDSGKAREKAMDQLMDLMETGTLGTELKEGFSPSQFVEIKEPEAVEDEDTVIQAVQTLSNLATLKIKVQESRSEALRIRKLVDLLFSDEIVEEEELSQLKEGFKTLKSFAQANLRYREARARAIAARELLDQALRSPEEAESSPPIVRAK